MHLRVPLMMSENMWRLHVSFFHMSKKCTGSLPQRAARLLWVELPALRLAPKEMPSVITKAQSNLSVKAYRNTTSNLS